MKAILELALREAKRILSHNDLRTMCLVAPILYGIVLTSTYYQGRLTELPMGVIDQDQTPFSRELLRKIDATETIRLVGHYQSAEEAHSAILKGEIEGFVLVPHSFSSKVKKLMDSTLFVSVSTSNFMVATPIITAISDVVSQVSADSLLEAMNKRGVNWQKSKKASEIIRLNTDVALNPKLSYANFMIPSLLYAILQQVLIVALAFSFIEEKQLGKLPELYALADRKVAKLLIGKALPYFALNFFLSVLFCYTLLPFFDIFPQSSFFLVALTSFIFVLSITFWGIFISTFFKTVSSAMIALMFYSMPTFLFSGISFPEVSMSLPIKIIRVFFPSSFFLCDIRSMVLGKIPLHYFLSHYFIMGLFTLGSFLVTIVVFKRWFRQNEREEQAQ